MSSCAAVCQCGLAAFDSAVTYSPASRSIRGTRPSGSSISSSSGGDQFLPGIRLAQPRRADGRQPSKPEPIEAAGPGDLVQSSEARVLEVHVAAISCLSASYHSLGDALARVAIVLVSG